MQTLRRLQSKFIHDPHSGCWLWQGSLTSDGYGRFWLIDRHVRAHRASYELRYGPIPEGMVVRHKCDVPQCVNPDHLELGTQADNNRDIVTRGRHVNQKKDRCPRDHEYTEENTYERNGKRYCRACGRDRKRAQRARTWA